MPRPDQMNINVATWGRLLKKNINLKNVSEQARTENEQNSGRNCHDKKETQIDTDNTIFPHFGFNIVCGNHGSSMQVCVSCSEMSSLKMFGFWNSQLYLDGGWISPETHKCYLKWITMIKIAYILRPKSEKKHLTPVSSFYSCCSIFDPTCLSRNDRLVNRWWKSMILRFNFPMTMGSVNDLKIT